MLCGILLLDKPRGLSSNAALQRVRGLLGRPKAGHVGSLDPLASGMLPICLGEATKVAGEILAGRKRYRFTVALGMSTTTGDAEGAPSASAAVPVLSRAAIEATLAGFLGETRQVPPMYSALKHAGQPLYRLARAGVSVPRQARVIELSELRLIGLDAASVELEALCSKGTYVRVLAEDIAAALGTLGHVTALRRLYVEPFQDEPMHTLESLAPLQASASADGPLLLPADWPLGALPAVRLAAAEARRVLQGQSVMTQLSGAALRVRIYDEAERFLGIGEVDAAGAVQPRRLLRPMPHADPQ
jgi:tRNA pseudouridine55 synthase